ncbi:hypothetical protein GF314_16575 [bacterium]|nr:hypothetical protein [bacterium]
MDLRELRVQRMPGVEAGFTVRGEPGLNLVIGPNGSGKTTLVRAALGLLWPDRHPPGFVEAVWDVGETAWHSERAGGATVAWQRAGVPASAPDLPPVSQAAAFHLGVLDLLKPDADEDDHALSRAVRRQLAGGFDVQRLLETLTVTGREGLAERRRLDTAEGEIRRRRQEQHDLADQESRLEGLRARRQAARDAGDRARALRTALALTEARDAAAIASTQLQERWPACMATLKPGDWSRLSGLRERLSGLRETLRSVADEEASALADLDATRLGDDPPLAEVVDLARDRIGQARQLDERLQHVREERRGAEAALAAAREALAPWGIPTDDAPADPGELRAAAARASERLRLAAEESGLQALLVREEFRDDADPADDPDRLAAARRAALQWLDAGGERQWPWPALVAGVSLIATGLIGDAWPEPWIGWVATGLGAAVVLWSIGWFVARPASRRARADLLATGLDPGEAWKPAPMRSFVDHLNQRAIAHAVRDLRHRLRERLIDEQEQLQRRASELAGDGPDALTELDLAERLHRGAAHGQARQRLYELTARCEDLEARLDDLRTHVVDALDGWLPDQATGDVTALAAAVEDLHRRRQAHAEAHRDLADARRRHRETGERIAEVSGEIEELLSSQDLGPDDDHELRRRVEALPEYERLAAAARETAAEVRVREAEFERLEPHLRDAVRTTAARGVTALREELDEASAIAAGLTDLDHEIVAIETRLARAESEVAFDRAIEARDAVRDELTELREQVRDVAIRRRLLELVERRHRTVAEPPVLARARGLLREFTHGRHELTLTGDDHGFRALDTRTGQGLPLTALSDGTRAQLLLAARLAYIAEAERGSRVPLFLDESLTAADPARFAAVAGAVLDLVDREERQVFYLTCDPADVMAWQRLRETRGLGPAPVTDLAELRALDAAASPARVRPPRPAPSPPADGEDPAAYARRLHVPPLAAAAPMGTVHLYHVLHHDLPLLHALVGRGAETVGQFQALADTLEAAGVIDGPTRAGLEARIRALAAFVDAFGVGRGRAVPRGELVREKAISSSKLPEVDALLDELGGDAARLLDALQEGRISRFREDKQDELEVWLRGQGYLDPRPTRDRDEVKTLVLQSARDDVGRRWLDMAELARLCDAWWESASGG